MIDGIGIDDYLSNVVVGDNNGDDNCDDESNNPPGLVTAEHVHAIGMNFFGIYSYESYAFVFIIKFFFFLRTICENEPEERRRKI